jgi:hypothetical protein
MADTGAPLSRATPDVTVVGWIMLVGAVVTIWVDLRATWPAFRHRTDQFRTRMRTYWRAFIDGPP